MKRKATTRVTGETGYVVKVSFYIDGKRVAYSSSPSFVCFIAGFSFYIGTHQLSLWNLERPPSPNTCSGSGALLDGVDHIGTQLPEPLYLLSLAITGTEVQLPRKYNIHALLYTLRNIKGQLKVYRFTSLMEWRSCPSLYEKPHLHVRISVCHQPSLYGKKGADKKRSLAGKRSPYEKIHLS